jgi:spore coat polysaccharide biosynthesis predicted glycosyltransferase SpsG/CMP-N-acetylneuraminic acid synthetase
MKGTVVFVSALQKNSAFQDDLLRKLGGKTLIERAIDKARQLNVEDSAIHVYTDVESVSLLAERTGVNVYLDEEFLVGARVTRQKFYGYLLQSLDSAGWLLRLSPYAPLLAVATITGAQDTLKRNGNLIAVGEQLTYEQSLDDQTTMVINELLDQQHEGKNIRSDIFTLLRAKAIREEIGKPLRVSFVDVGEDGFEVRSYQDWWVCEKLLQRKRIVFRVVGNREVGMGHIYRALSLAHEITDHEVIFVTDTENEMAINELERYDYRLEVCKPDDVVTTILALKPNLVVNDILDTSMEDVVPLQSIGSAVVNFEDLGEGAKMANATINELYDDPQYQGSNTYWGNQYFFVRDEFSAATPCEFREKVEALLLAFGGVDQHDLTRKILFTVLDLCRLRDIHIYVVTGPGYAPYQELAQQINNMDGVTLTHATGVISRIMEKVSLAITSNGRTVYEMAHMNIPAIVIPQHEREKTHAFACEANGFIPLEPYNEPITKTETLTSLTHLLDRTDYRQRLYNNTTRYRFDRNKQRVIELIGRLMQQS